MAKMRTLACMAATAMFLLMCAMQFQNAGGMTVPDQDKNLGGTGVTYANGTWTLDANATYSNQTINVNGPVYVNATLTLCNVTLFFNSSYDLQYGIQVNSSGRMVASDLDIVVKGSYMTSLVLLQGSSAAFNGSHITGTDMLFLEVYHATLALSNSTMAPVELTSNGSSLSLTRTDFVQPQIYLEASGLQMSGCSLVDGNLSCNDTDVRISGTTLDNMYTLSFTNATDVVCEDSDVFNPGAGISALSCTQATLDNVTITGSKARASYFWGCGNITVIGCNITSAYSSGVSAYNGYGAKVSGCMLGSNYNGIYTRDVTSVEITSNTLADSGQYGIFARGAQKGAVSGNNVSSSALYDLYIYECGNLSVSNNTVPNADKTGILAVSSNRLLIEYNRISNVASASSSGLRMFQSQDCRVLWNVLINASWGLELGDSSLNTVSHNDVAHSEFGIYLHTSDDNLVELNIVSNNSYGFVVKLSSGNSIKNNTILDNYGGLHHESSADEIYHNQFLGNTHQAFDNGLADWDAGSELGGNYWSDYTGLDLDGDSLGDTPYLINASSGAKDRYPLMYPSSTIAPLRFTYAPGLDHDGYFALNWSTSPLATGYELQSDNDSLFPSPFSEYIGANNSVQFAGKPPGTWYFRVLAYSGSAIGLWSAAARVDVVWPVNLTNNITVAPMPDGHSLNISLSVPMHPDLEHTVYCNRTGTWEALSGLDASAPYYVHKGLVPGQPYHYKLKSRAYRIGQEVFSGAVTGVPMDLMSPPVPTGLDGHAAADLSVSLNWDPVVAADLAGYNIYRSENMTSNYTRLNPAPLTSPAYTDADLANKRTYYYTVTSVDGVPNESPFSAIKAIALDFDFPPELRPYKTELVLTEDVTDYDGLNLHDWFVDPDNESLDFTILYSEHLSIQVFDTGNVTIIPQPNWNGKTNITVMARDAFFVINASMEVTVTGVNDPPTTFISQPANLAKSYSGTDITFISFCSDPDLVYGDRLTYVWTSSIDGVFGSSQNITTSNLSVGEHRINLTVTDLWGASSTYSIILDVKEKSDPPPVEWPWLYPLIFGMGLVVLIIILIMVYLIIRHRAAEASRSRDVRIEEFEGAGPIEDFIEDEGGENQCPECGAKLVEEATRCYNCGAVFEEEYEDDGFAQEDGRVQDAEWREEGGSGDDDVEVAYEGDRAEAGAGRKGQGTADEAEQDVAYEDDAQAADGGGEECRAMDDDAWSEDEFEDNRSDDADDVDDGSEGNAEARGGDTVEDEDEEEDI